MLLVLPLEYHRYCGAGGKKGTCLPRSLIPSNLDMNLEFVNLNPNANHPRFCSAVMLTARTIACGSVQPGAYTSKFAPHHLAKDAQDRVLNLVAG